MAALLFFIKSELVMENKQTITKWSIFYNRKLNQAQWRSLKNGPMSLTHPEKKHFKRFVTFLLCPKSSCKNTPQDASSTKWPVKNA